jgi:protein-L-isoaspartate(D-aspartate) O-methyltransferase
MKPYILLLVVFIVYPYCGEIKEQDQNQKLDKFTMKREHMVKSQIEARGIKNKDVLEALIKVPRHEFVPENIQDFAYADEPLSIGSGQTISQPYIVAYMTEILDLKKSDRILEIGTGSGYQAAVLAELCDSVYTIEILPELSERAQKVLHKLNYQNIYFKIGNGFYGWKEKSPFDAIIVTAAPEEIPESLVEQLAEGGRMIIPVGDFFQELYLITRTRDGIKKRKTLPVRFVPLQGVPDAK